MKYTCLPQLAAAILLFAGMADAQTDPGVRGGPPGAGAPISGLTSAELAAFTKFLATFNEVEGVANGLGPGFNLNSCSGCHAQPAAGGSSPAINPQIAMATANGATNVVPRFLSLNGPVREVRFVQNPDGSADGGVHDLFSIKGRTDAPGCTAPQTDFSNTSNLRFRIPTPTFGGGLIEAIPDSAIVANLANNSQIKSRMGISGHVNTNGNDGTVTRFGWKAQNKSLTVFAGEAYNVEEGVTNEVFPNERNWTSGCMYNGVPEDYTNFATDQYSDVESFATVMRFLAPPKPATPSVASATDTATASTTASSLLNGQNLFSTVGCALCHTPSLVTGKSTSAALTNITANLYSDLAVHNMGQGLADGITQGSAQGNEFRTAPLWGVGQRIFFLHDGRTNDLLQAIQAHSSQGSEANAVIQLFNALPNSGQQAILNFLRSL